MPKPWVIVASGPSLCAEDVEHCRGKSSVVVTNDSYRLAPWADWVFAADLHWWHAHADKVPASMGKATTNSTASWLYNLKYYKVAGSGGYVPHRTTLSDGRNSGHYALDMAFKLGAREIYLLGFDFQHTGGRKHWFGDHPKGWNNADGVATWCERLPRLVAGLEQRGARIVNCSRETSIACLPRARIQDVLT